VWLGVGLRLWQSLDGCVDYHYHRTYYGSKQANEAVLAFRRRSCIGDGVLLRHSGQTA